MAQQVIGVGTVAGDGTGDKGQVPFQKVNANFADLYAQVTALQTGVVYYGTDGGAANAYAVTISVGSGFGLTTGVFVRFTAANANTGASTLNVNGTGVITIVGITGAALVGGEILTTGPTLVQYNSTAWQIVATGTPVDHVRTAGEITATINPPNYFFIGRPVVDLRRYGWVGDGVTDDSNAFAQAMNASQKGIRIWVPDTASGSLVNTGFTLPNNRSVWLEGGGSTIKYGGAAGTYLATIFNNSSSATDPQPVISGLDFLAGTAGSQNGVKITDSQSIMVRNCRFRNFKRGLTLVNTTLWTEQFAIDQLDFWGCTQSIYLDRGGGTGSVATFQARRVTVNTMVGAVLLSASISGATQANPCVITTSANHGFESGDVVLITGVAGMTQLNGLAYCIKVLSNTTFQLTGVNATGFGAWTSGGTVAQVPIGMLITTNTSIYRGGLWGLNIFVDVNNSIGTFCDGDWSGARGQINVENTAASGVTGNTGIWIGPNFSGNPCEILNDIRGTVATKHFIPGASQYGLINAVQVPGLMLSNASGFNTGIVRRGGIQIPIRAVYDTDFAITGITQAASAVVTINSPAPTNPFSVGEVATIYGVNGMTQINGTSATVSAIGGAAGAWTITVSINSSAFSAYTSGGGIQGVRYAERLTNFDVMQRLVPAQTPLEVRDPVTLSQFSAERHITIGTGTNDITSGTTPSITGSDCARLNYGGATNITNFTGAFDGHELALVSVNGNPTLVHNDVAGGIVLKSGANFTFTTHATKHLKFIIDRWYEL
jgi:hypothetical protein